MSDLNNITSNITALRGKLLGDISSLIRMYGELEDTVRSRFRDEYERNAGSSNGLEDFYMLNSVVKKNHIAVKNAHSIIKRMADLSKYDISETTEEVMDAELEKLLEAK